MSWFSSIFSGNSKIASDYKHDMEKLQNDALNTEYDFLKNMSQIGLNTESKLCAMSTHHVTKPTASSYPKAVYLILKR